MFLNRLDQQSKVTFLKLAYHVAKSDESFTQMERSLIEGYLNEMNISDIEYEEETFSLEECLNNIANKEYQKIILIELLAIVYTDNLMHSKEKEIIDTIVDTWNINSSLVVVYGEWSRSLLSLHIQGEALLELS